MLPYRPSHHQIHADLCNFRGQHHDPVVAQFAGKMRYIHSQETLEIPDDVKVLIKTRVINVEGPRGQSQII